MRCRGSFGWPLVARSCAEVRCERPALLRGVSVLVDGPGRRVGAADVSGGCAVSVRPQSKPWRDPGKVASISTAQRALILRLMRELEFDTQTVTVMHKRFGMPPRWIGGPVSTWLDQLTRAAASSVIRKLKALVA